MDHAVSIVKYDIILPVIILRVVMVITRLFLSHKEVCCLRKVANYKIEKLFFEAFLSILIICKCVQSSFCEALPGGGGEGGHVAHLNFKTSRVGVYKCLSLIVGFAVTVAIWPREVVSCRDFILRAVATFWAMSLVRIYPGRASLVTSGILITTKWFK